VEEIRFDDIGNAQGEISDAFGEWSEPVEVTQEMIDRFAELTGDHQWIHVDVEARAAREARSAERSRTASSRSACCRGCTAARHGSSSATATRRTTGRTSSASSRPSAGAKVHAHGRLIGVEAHPKGTQVTQEIQVNVVGQDRPALIYEMVVLYHPPMKRAVSVALRQQSGRFMPSPGRAG